MREGKSKEISSKISANKKKLKKYLEVRFKSQTFAIPNQTELKKLSPKIWVWFFEIMSELRLIVSLYRFSQIEF